MGFAFYLPFLVLTFVRPWEFYESLQSLPIIGGVSALAVGATLFSLFMGRGPTTKAPQPYLALLFVLWVVFSFVAATRWMGGVSLVMGEILPSLLMFFLTFLNVDTIARLRTTAATLALLALFFVGQGAFAYHFGDPSGLFLVLESAEGDEVKDVTATRDPASEARALTVARIRNVGFLADPNDFAQALVTITPLLFALRLPRRRFRNTLFVWAPAVAILYGVGLTRSRGALVALLALVFYAFRHRLGRVLSLALAAISTVGLVALGFTGGRALSMDESSEGRIEAWFEGLQMLRGAPVWGVGYGNFADLYHLVAHNSFVHCFAETGLVGYFLWLWLVVLTFTEMSTLSRRSGESQESAEAAHWGSTIHLALVGFLTGALFLSRTYSPVLFLILGLGAALSDMARRRDQVIDPTPVMRWVPRIVGLEIASIIGIWVAVRTMM
jgi:hypothetical protein